MDSGKLGYYQMGSRRVDERGRKLFGVRNPQKFGSTIKTLVSSFGNLKLNKITVAHLTEYRKTRLSTKTRKGTYTDVANSQQRVIDHEGNA